MERARHHRKSLVRRRQHRRGGGCEQRAGWLHALGRPPGPIAINENLYKKLTFRPADLMPITVLGMAPNVLDVRRGFPAKTVKELTDHAKSNPGNITFASQGNGSTSHLAAILLEKLTGTKTVHVPCRGSEWSEERNDFNEVSRSILGGVPIRGRNAAPAGSNRSPHVPTGKLQPFTRGFAGFPVNPDTSLLLTPPCRLAFELCSTNPVCPAEREILLHRPLRSVLSTPGSIAKCGVG